jgi:hypothetical protein
MIARVTIGKHGGSLWIIKKSGKEITYAETKSSAQKKAKAIRA